VLFSEFTYGGEQAIPLAGFSSTAGHMQLPGRGVAYVGSFGYLSGNPTRKRPEAATAHTGERCTSHKKPTSPKNENQKFAKCKL
jgi:hypothetical protein